MTSTDGSHGPLLPKPHSKLWSIGLTLLLFAIGYRLRSLSARPISAPSSMALEHGRGRSAHTPFDIPAKGWKDIFLRIYSNVGEHQIMDLAAGMTFYSLLAMFPALAALVAIYGLFSDPNSITAH